MKNTILLFVLSVSVIFTTSAAEYETTVKIIRGEKWWGIYAENSPQQPFTGPFKTTTDGFSKTSFLLSSEGRYIWSSQPLEVKFDDENIIAGSDYEAVKVEKAGRTLREAYLVCAHKNFPPGGETPDPEMFSMPLYETSLEFPYAVGDKEILGYAERLLKEGFPHGIIVIEDGWRSLNNGYDFDRELFSDFAGTLRQLHSMGFKVMLTVTDRVPQVGRNYVEAQENGYLLTFAGADGIKEEDIVFSTSGSVTYSLYDIDNEKAYEIIASGVNNFRNSYPVDGFRFETYNDFPDHSQSPDLVARWLKLRKENELTNYTVPGTKIPLAPYVTNVASIPDVTETANASVLRNIITASLLGFPYVNTINTLEHLNLCMEDNALGAAFLVMQSMLPVASMDFAPWRITDPKLYNAVKEAFDFRASISDYIEELVTESGRTAEPIVRHMEYQFPRSGFWDCDDQFMLGPKYLVAPNVTGADKRIVRLPRGQWTDRDGRRFRGPLVTEVDCSAGRLVYFELSR